MSGDIILEDLTEAYGDGEYYVVGYCYLTDVWFDYYVSLILEGGIDIPILSGMEFIELDGVRAVAFSKAAVDEWALANGYTKYDVRLSFVPEGGDGSFDYGITFTEDEDLSGTISGAVSFTDYIGEGETKYYVITPTEDGTWVFTSFADGDTLVFLYDAENNLLDENDDGSNLGNNFRLVYELKAGETYVIGVKWYGLDKSGDVPLLFTPI